MAKRKKSWKVERPEYDRLSFAVARAIRGMSASDVARAAAKAGMSVSPQTVRNLRYSPNDGGTRFPRFYTMQCVLASVGQQFTVEDIKQPKRSTKPAEAEARH